MNSAKAKGLLLAVLVLQLALAAWLFFGDSDAARDARAVAELDISSLDILEITDGKGNKLRLSRKDGGWRVADSPADDDKVEAMLGKIAAMQTAWPVATSDAAQARFEVAEDNFQRRLQLYTGDTKVADLLFGTSPGFRRVHLREQGGKEIFSVDFANHELPVGEDDWLDRGLLASAEPVVGIQRLEHWSLARTTGPEPRWELNGADADQDAATTLAGRFSGLQVLGRVVLEGELKGSFVVTSGIGEGAKSHRYALYHNEEQDKYYVTRDDNPARFEIAGYIAEQMLLDADSLEPQPATPEESTGEAGLAEQVVEQALEEITEMTSE